MIVRRTALLVCGVLASICMTGCGEYAPGQPAPGTGTTVAYNPAPVTPANPNVTAGVTVPVDPNAGLPPAAGVGGGGVAGGLGAGATGASQLSVQTLAGLGSAVVDAGGWTLYRFDKDTANPPASNCAGVCAKTWPPELVGKVKPVVRGISASLVGTVRRPDGTIQLTLAGWPLYRYSGDARSGARTGQGKGGTWWVVQPDGKRNTAGAPPVASARPTPTVRRTS
jgi:predicted lipoprotein with Yx(FWY)xxD motif